MPCPAAAHGVFFFNDTAPPEISPLSLHDALPISGPAAPDGLLARVPRRAARLAPGREGPGAGGGPEPARRRVRHREPLRRGRHRRRDAAPAVRARGARHGVGRADARRPPRSGAPAAERTEVGAMRWVRGGLLAG